MSKTNRASGDVQYGGELFRGEAARLCPLAEDVHHLPERSGALELGILELDPDRDEIIGRELGALRPGRRQLALEPV